MVKVTVKLKEILKDTLAFIINTRLILNDYYKK